MDQWRGKLAVVTGASSGIGAAIVCYLANHGVHVVAFARRLHRLQDLSDEMRNADGKVYPYKIDLTEDNEIVKAFNWIDDNIKLPVQILINNAGRVITSDIKECNTEEWRNTFNLNVIAAGSCISRFFKSLKHYGIPDGHIINICSIAGVRAVDVPGLHVYSGTKHAIRAITHGIRKDLTKDDSFNKIRITNICPGLVNTEIFDPVRLMDTNFQSPLDSGLPALKSEDIANAVVYILGLPQNVSITELVIQPTGEKL